MIIQSDFGKCIPKYGNSHSLTNPRSNSRQPRHHALFAPSQTDNVLVVGSVICLASRRLLPLTSGENGTKLRLRTELRFAPESNGPLSAKFWDFWTPFPCPHFTQPISIACMQNLEISLPSLPPQSGHHMWMSPYHLERVCPSLMMFFCAFSTHCSSLGGPADVQIPRVLVNFLVLLLFCVNALSPSRIVHSSQEPSF